jgi:hypothetical protein
MTPPVTKMHGALYMWIHPTPTEHQYSNQHIDSGPYN